MGCGCTKDGIRIETMLSKASKLQGLFRGTRTWSGLNEDRGLDSWLEGTAFSFAGPSTWALASSAAALPWQSYESSTSQVCRRMPLPVRQHCHCWMCGRVRGVDEQVGGQKKARTALCRRYGHLRPFCLCACEKKSWRRLEVMHHQAEAFGLEQVASMCWRRAPWCRWESRYVNVVCPTAACKDLCSSP